MEAIVGKSRQTDDVDARTNKHVPQLNWPVHTHADYIALHEELTNLPPTPRLVHVDEVPVTSAPGRTYEWLISSEQSGGSIVLHRLTLQPGFVAEHHNHIAEEEFFYVLDGELELTIGTETRIAGPGSMGYAPPFAPHSFDDARGRAVRGPALEHTGRA
jgi:quercetin dioxygenase-like cupin family protein